MGASRFGLSLACTILIGCLNFAHAGEGRNESKARAQEATAKAIAAELAGDLETRANLLEEAAKADPYSPAHVQQGMLRDKGRWLSIDEAAEKIAEKKALQRYEELRDQLPDTAPAHWKMAQLCVTAKLADQARAHTDRVLQLDPNFEPARAALGFKKIGGVWVSPQQIALEDAHAKAEAASIAKYGKTMREILSGLKSTAKQPREKALQSLAAIRDADAILAAEKILSPENEPIALAVIDHVATIKDPIATLSLARHAVFYPGHEARHAAAIKLGERDLHDYAPSLLALLSSPIQSGAQPVFNQRGQLMGLRQVFTREGQEQNQVLMVDTEVVRQPVATRVVGLRNGLEAATARALAARDNQAVENITQSAMASQSQSREEAVRAQNVQIEQTNARVMHALSVAANVELPPYPDSWWKWYDDEIGLLRGENKYTTASRVYLQNYAPTYQVAMETPVAIGGGECFVAGTVVTTHRGLIAIEKIKLGDLVLSKNIAKGVLEFKPVLQTTIRPIEEVTILRAGANQFECTRGHFFWVSGRGWVKAEDLRPGMVLHAAESPVKIDEVCMGREAETYNLRVADNANYFVGQGRILSHDVTPRTPTREVIPGYIAAP
jgi:hypothetical protein